ncbi:sulfite reductase [Hymenobacter qilianensis]|uniref:Sulfite reductase n=2 Tax=Hymenobacter qilianensis TaxID=1385715 RepID=A0ACB5PPP7_9BACT|nr:PepSY-associated TM helix domain-containing protein [Hymenobacter qilianensis]QNP53118.1 PepSY domain-containing protein [Hymenobacter qilianensis]GGF59581.1 sulfite reductase [Hymenobacter qilianensis]
MTPLKQAIRKLHLWLGLASGLVVFIVSITGAIFTFQEEIREATEPWLKVPVAATPALPPSRLQAAMLRNHPGLTSPWVMYMAPDRSALVYGTDKAGGSYAAFVDPYTGQELHYKDLKRDFFTIVQEIHMYLLLPVAVGEWVVGIGVLIFVVMLITGMVLWWPKRKKDRHRSFTIKWNGRWRRVNYDLHNVLGFYTASIALIIALTGLVMSFEWVNNSVYLTANMGSSFPEEKMPPKVTAQPVSTPSLPLIDQFYAQIRRGSPTAQMLYVAAPVAPDQPAYSIAYRTSLLYSHRDEYYFHPTTGEVLKAIPDAGKSRGQKLIDANYDIHTGQILGLGGKIIAFLVSLISASLPVTGTLVWWGKRNKPKKEKPRRPQPVQAV